MGGLCKEHARVLSNLTWQRPLLILLIPILAWLLAHKVRLHRTHRAFNDLRDWNQTIKWYQTTYATGIYRWHGNQSWLRIGLLVQNLHALKHPKALFHFTPITTQLQHHLRISLRWFQSCHMTRRQAQLKGRWSHCHAKCPANDRESAGHRVGPRAMHLANFA